MGKRILITGGTGYLGSELANELTRMGNSVYVLTRMQSDTSRLELDLSGLFLVTDENMESLVKDILPLDIIIHSATNYGKGSDTNRETLSANLILPFDLLNAGKKHGVPVFINIDTILARDVNIYSMTKKQFLDWGKMFSREKKIKFVNILLHNIYGKAAPKDNFIGQIIRTFLKNTEKFDFSEGRQKRDFIFINDVIESVKCIIKSINKTSSFFIEYEIGSGEAVSIRDIVNLIKKKTKSCTDCRFGGLNVQVNEKKVYCANLVEIKKTGWFPKENFSTGLDKTIEFERKRLIK